MKAVSDPVSGSGSGQERRDRHPQAALTVNAPQLLLDGTDLEFRRFVHDALAFSSRLQAVRDGFARLIGLTGIQYTILVSIYHLEFEQRVGINTVAEHLHLSGTFVTTETNKLAAAGLVEKTRDADDRRRINLSTTMRARDRLSSLASVQSHINDAHFAPLSPEDFDRLRSVMPQLVASTDRALRLLESVHSLEESLDLANTALLTRAGSREASS